MPRHPFLQTSGEQDALPTSTAVDSLRLASH
jgi:hypothetical protein